MTKEEAKNILRHYDDSLWQRDNDVTIGMVADAIRIGEEALESPWKSVNEELPGTNDVQYLVILKDMSGNIFKDLCYFDNRDGKWYGGLIRTEGIDEVTHWMPIPETPNE